MHGKSLTGASLAIGKNADVVAVKGAFYHALDRVEDAYLVCCVSKDLVELESVFRLDMTLILE